VRNDSNNIVEMENPNNTPRQISIQEISTIQIVSQSDDYYYLFGMNGLMQPLLLRVNPTNDSVSVLLQPDQYEVYKMTVSSDNEITFNAMRMSNGNIVIGRISASGQISIMDTTINTEVIVLERIR
jgi:hypothetical protein